jgi:hypothetical protein
MIPAGSFPALPPKTVEPGAKQLTRKTDPLVNLSGRCHNTAWRGVAPCALIEVSRAKERAAVIGLKRPAIVLAIALISLASLGAGSRAYGQAIAYEPVIGFIPTGSTLTVTPAVSADRRYVRLTVNPYFNALNGFQNFTSQLGAVGGGTAGGLAGMNGPIGQGAGGAVGGGVGQGMTVGLSEYPLAGPYLAAGEFRGDPFAAEGTFALSAVQRPDPALAGAADEETTPQASAAAPARSRTGKKIARPEASSSASSTRTVRKPAQKSTSASRRRGYVRQIDPFLEME